MSNRPSNTLIVIFLKCKGFFFFPPPLVCNEPLWLAHHQKNIKNWNIQHSPQSWSIELLPFDTPLNRIWKFKFGSKKIGIKCDAMKVRLWAQKTMVILGTSWEPSLGSYGNMVGGEGNTKIPTKNWTHTVSQEKNKIKSALFHSIFLHLV